MRAAGGERLQLGLLDEPLRNILWNGPLKSKKRKPLDSGIPETIWQPRSLKAAGRNPSGSTAKTSVLIEVDSLIGQTIPVKDIHDIQEGVKDTIPLLTLGSSFNLLIGFSMRCHESIAAAKVKNVAMHTDVSTPRTPAGGPQIALVILGMK